MSPLSILAEPRSVDRSQISTWAPKQYRKISLVQWFISGVFRFLIGHIQNQFICHIYEL
jgi:hypothetical protein